MLVSVLADIKLCKELEMFISAVKVQLKSTVNKTCWCGCCPVVKSSASHSRGQAITVTTEVRQFGTNRILAEL